MFDGNTNYASSLEYHPSGALTRYTAGNGLVTVLSYDQNRYWPQSITAGPLGLQYQQYDAVGNVGQIADSRQGRSQTFTYDALDRLTSATSDGGYPAISWAYDVHGNRQTSGGTTYSYEPGTLRLASQGGSTFTYYNNGNLWTAPNATYTYTPRNMLESAAVVGGTTTYRYDAGDMRVKKTTAGANTYFLRGTDQQVLTEWLNPGPTGQTRDYVYAGSRLLATVERNPWAEDATDLYGWIIPGGPSVPLTLAAGQNGRLKFDGAAGQRVSAKLQLTSSGTFSCYWYLRILKPDGTELASTVACVGTVLFLDTQLLPEDGTYTLMIDPSGTLAGSISATMYDVVHVTGPIIPDGPPVYVPIGTPGQNGVFTFTGTAGQRVSASITVTSGTFTDWWYLRLLKPDGSELAYTVTWYGTVLFLDARTLPVDGIYTLVVDPALMVTGSVHARLYSSPLVTRSIQAGGPPVPVPLLKPGQNGELTFNGTAGQRLSASITLQSGSFTEYWYLRIRKPDGNELGYAVIWWGSVLFLDTQTLPATGTYTLVIDPNWMATGTVDARLYAVSHVSGPIQSDGTPVPVPLVTPGQNGELTFTATAGHQVNASITRTSGTFTDWWYLRLRKPDATQLAYSVTWYGTVLTLNVQNLPVSGTYTLVVDPEWMATGTVDARVTVSPP